MTLDPFTSSQRPLHSDVKLAIDWISARSPSAAAEERDRIVDEILTKAKEFHESGESQAWISGGCPHAAEMSAHVNGPLALWIAQDRSSPRARLRPLGFPLFPTSSSFGYC